MSKQKKINLFTKANGVKILVFYIAFHVIFYALSLIFSTTFMQLFTIKEMGSADFTFNDLYYRVVASENFEKDPYFRNEKSVVLINTGVLDKTNFRLELANLLLKLEDYQPAVIAIDHEFRNDTSIVGTVELKEAANYFGNIIFAYDPLETNMLSLGEKGVVVFPLQTSIRYYKNSEETFAYRIAQRLSNQVKPLTAKQDSFPIHYCSYDRGYTNWEDDMNRLYDINFKAIEGLSFINPDSSTYERLKQLLKGKAVILGNLGNGDMNNMFDIEDKFKVPVDSTSVTDRERIMPGSVIHANVIENFLHPEGIFWDFKGFWFILWQQLSYLLFLIIVLFTDINNIIKKTLLGFFSIISLFFVIKLMYWGIYISMGITLLQLLVIEEIAKTFEPFYEKLEKYFNFEKDEAKIEKDAEVSTTTNTNIDIDVSIETKAETTIETNIENNPKANIETAIENEPINEPKNENSTESNQEII